MQLIPQREEERLGLLQPRLKVRNEVVFYLSLLGVVLRSGTFGETNPRVHLLRLLLLRCLSEPQPAHLTRVSGEAALSSLSEDAELVERLGFVRLFGAELGRFGFEVVAGGTEAGEVRFAGGETRLKVRCLLGSVALCVGIKAESAWPFEKRKRKTE